MANDPQPPNRRARLRGQTIDEILLAARDQVADAGISTLSLRSVARQVGMTPSALYRYFESKEELIGALVRDGFATLADEVAAIEAEVKRTDFMGRWMAATGAYRTWLMANPFEHSLLFGAPIPGYEKRHNDSTSEEFYRGVGVLFAIVADALSAGKVDTKALDAELTPMLRKQIRAWRDEASIELPDGVLLACLQCWTHMLGAINAELFCHLPPSFKGNDALFTQQMRSTWQRLRIA